MDGGDGTVRVKPGRGFESETDGAVSSPVTRQKAAAAKQFIENHYKNYLQGLHERMERFGIRILFVCSFSCVNG